MDELEQLLQHFQAKLEAVQQMVESYEENMDYATHCNLQGFAEGLRFAIDEIKDRLK